MEIENYGEIAEPRYDRVLVEEIPEKDHFIKNEKLDLIKPDTAKGKNALVYGRVVSAGFKCENLKKGDMVGWENGAGIPAVPEDPESKLLFIRDQNLIVKIND